MNAKSFISPDTFTRLITSIIDLENSNLPIDYFTSVLPRAQYGDESAVPVGSNNSDVVFSIFDAADNKKGVIINASSYAANDDLQIPNSAPVSTPDGYVTQFVLLVLVIMCLVLEVIYRLLLLL